MSSSIQFPIDDSTFQENQNVNLSFEDEICQVILKQNTSTPGFRLKQSVEIEKGNYELVVTGKASVNDTFFLWVQEEKSKQSIGGTVHLSKTKEQIITHFSIESKCTINVGVLAHKHQINDKCWIDSIEIRPKIFQKQISKPQFLERNQNAILSNNSDHWKITANQDNSTPGCRLSLSVTPNALHAIEVDVRVNSSTASAFLWAYSRIDGHELLPRVHLFSGGPEAQRIKKTVYLNIPENINEILVGVLFSSSGLKPTDSFNIFSLDVEEITTLGDIADSGYVLNLDGEEEKFSYCEHVLRREGFEVNRMPAVRGADEPFISRFNIYNNAPFNDEDLKLGRKAIQSPGAWGYLLTMEKIITDAIEKGYRCIAVFDDDIILTHDFTLKFSRFIKGIPSGWDTLMLGASQWDWTNVIISDKKGFYLPNQLSNGSFAMIYNSSIFEDLLSGIKKMTSPFDSKPLKDITTSKNNKSYVAWPNLVIADVEKEGIRDSRDQKTYASRFRWRMEEFPNNYKRWRSKPILLYESIPKSWPRKDVLHFVMSVTTINRWDYLEKFLATWIDTRNTKHDWTLVIADDGSSDSTLQNIIQYDIPFTKVVVIQNSGKGIAVQTNSLLSYVQRQKFDLMFSADDDIYFNSPGWDDAYYNAVLKTGFDHLVHFNENWKEKKHVQHLSKEGVELVSMTDGISCMGCFYTITPRILETIGGFDEIAFPIRGHSHIDFTMRASRNGFNDLNQLYDIANAPKYLGIHPKEGYVTTLRRYSYKEQMVLSDQNDKVRRWNLINQEDRKFVQLPSYDFLQPEEYHLQFGKYELLPQRRTDWTNSKAINPKKPSLIHVIPADSKYDHHERWSFVDDNLRLKYKGFELWWKMPDNYSFEDAHPDLFKLAEYVLLSPMEPNILDNWVPSRKPGHRPGLAFSAGCDSTAAMELLPEQTVLLYHKREGFDSILDHTNALRFIQYLKDEKGKKVIVVNSNHELIRTINGDKSPGFITDYACAVHVILLADHLSLDSIATGMPLENSFLWKGQKYRDFQSSWFWKKNAPLFNSVGLPILQPVMGCSEVVNQKIVTKSGYSDYAQSCLRSSTKDSCGECWKCFRKNSILGREIKISNEIHTFLNKPKLKMAASTIYSIQQMKENNIFFRDIVTTYPSVSDNIHMDVSFLEKHYPLALELIPDKYKKYIKAKIATFVDDLQNLELLENFNLYD